MSQVKMRQEVERKIAEAFITDALAAGYKVAVDNRQDDETKPMGRAAKILAAMFQTDLDYLFLYRGGERVGWVFFVYGNDGWDVISDYTVNLESLMKGANKISKHYED